MSKTSESYSHCGKYIYVFADNNAFRIINTVINTLIVPKSKKIVNELPVYYIVVTLVNYGTGGRVLLRNRCPIVSPLITTSLTV